MSEAEQIVYGRGKALKNQRHGKCKTPIYSIWLGMMRRCYEKHNPAYHNYGGRGIFVCDRWHLFVNFYADMGEKPAGMSIDRVDNNLGYSKENCAWKTYSDQNRNRRNNHRITIGSKTKTLVEWCEIYNQPVGRVSRRINLGWDELKALKEPLIPNSTLHRGASHYKAKLNDEKVRELRGKFDAGIPRKNIAEHYGISLSSVHKIGARVDWSHVEDEVLATAAVYFGVRI